MNILSKTLTLLLTGSMLIFITACTPITVDDYAQNQPPLIPEDFFNGELTAHGIVKNRSGKVIRYFNATITAYWKDGTGTLEEDFIFDDGEKQRRVWTLTPNNDNTYTGTADDVIEGATITLAGNSLFLDYVLRTPYKDGTIDLKIDDRMYLVSPKVLINESTMSKYGVNVGSLLLVIKRAN